MWNRDSESVVYADDDIEIVVGHTKEECQRNAQLAADRIYDWYSAVGLSINEKKSEVMGIGFNPEPITVGSIVVQPSKSMKFLGC